MKRGRESGQVLPLVALCFAMLTGFAGMGVDVGYWRYQQRQQQSATDAAAIGAAQQLLYSGCPSAAAGTAGQSDASSNGFTNGVNGVTVAIDNPPTTGVHAGISCAAMATITSTNVPTFFTKLLGRQTVKETTKAVAQVVASSNPCMIMLAQNQNTNFNNATVQAPGCSMYINGSANFNGAKVNAAAIEEANYAGSNNNGTFTGASPTKSLPMADPCPEIAGCAALTSNPPSTSPCTGTYSSGALTPGCYNNLNLHGANVTMSPGLYVFEGSANFNGASIAGTGVTIYMPAGASVNFNKVSSLQLSPPTTGTYANVTYYQVATNTNDINFNGSNTNISGLVYAPSAQMNWNGSQNGYALLVAAYANFNGSTGEQFGTPPAGSTFLKKVVLSE